VCPAGPRPAAQGQRPGPRAAAQARYLAPDEARLLGVLQVEAVALGQAAVDGALDPRHVVHKPVHTAGRTTSGERGRTGTRTHSPKPSSA
jgi:hypothetical protein